QHLFDTGAMKSGSYIARAEGLHPSVPNELMRLTLLAPDILDMLMSGRQPRWMNLIWFQRNPLPVDWEAQRQIVQRFEEAT
ncbi:MAG: site-specific recombinase resolvase, partial [Verrucomicrobiota bacterium]